MLCLYDLQHLIIFYHFYIFLYFYSVSFIWFYAGLHMTWIGVGIVTPIDSLFYHRARVIFGTWMATVPGCDDHPTGLAQPAESACGFAAADQLWGRNCVTRGRNWKRIGFRIEVYSKIILKLDILYWTSKIIIWIISIIVRLHFSHNLLTFGLPTNEPTIFLWIDICERSPPNVSGKVVGGSSAQAKLRTTSQWRLNCNASKFQKRPQRSKGWSLPQILKDVVLMFWWMAFSLILCHVIVSILVAEDYSLSYPLKIHKKKSRGFSEEVLRA